ncbi:hypothetical protein [Aquimarina sp. 2304DJ70-9]|uniref:hypothetical protein n=1 Tax=Aquimarina penaris TaxID=3231044 RepID=UPI0034619891
MKDYNNLLKAELIELLQKRDTEIVTLENQKLALEQDKNTYATKIQNLEKELQQCQDTTGDINTADQLIEAVLCLPEDEVHALPALLRTTNKGIEAFTAFTYGSLSCISDGPDTGNPDNPFPCEGQIPTILS